jgi:hypothetical protein
MAKRAAATNTPRLGVLPKNVTVGENMTFRVYGEHLNQLSILDFPAPTSNTHGDWSTPTIVDIKNHYIEFESTPGSRRFGRDDEGDVTITITFDDGTTEGQAETVSCDDLVYDDTFATSRASKGAKKKKASAKGSTKRSAASARKRGGASKGKKKRKT